jgi:hypothetical protein
VIIHQLPIAKTAKKFTFLQKGAASGFWPVPATGGKWAFLTAALVVGWT